MLSMDIRTGKAVQTFAGHESDINASYRTCGSLRRCNEHQHKPTNQHVFISEACDAFAKRWDIRTGEAVQTFAERESDVDRVVT